MPEIDIYETSPDDGHEAILAAVRAAIEELGFNTGDVGLLLSLLDSLYALLEDRFTQIDDLTARIAALETPAAPPL